MVSFSCENCGDVLTKKKLDTHRNSCRGASFTCLDCMVHFSGTEYRAHTSCISEAQKYQGNMYKPKKSQQQSTHKSTPSQSHPQPLDSTNNSDSPTKSTVNDESNNSTALVPRGVYIEETSQQTTSIAIVDAPPRAPSPPPAPVNVFDFLVQENGDDEWESDDDDMHAEYAARPAYATHGYEYGSRRVSAGAERYDSGPDLRSRAHRGGPKGSGDFVTPDPRRSHARKISTDSTGQKKSGKRKRGQPEDLDMAKINGDVVMTDVPPLHHSGLTGGLHRLTTEQRNGLPPSPDDSPNSPIKRSRRDDRDRKDRAGRRKSSDSEKADRKRTKHQRGRDEPNGTGKTSSKTAAAAAKTTTSKRRTLLGSVTRKRSVSPSNSPSRKKPALKAIEYPSSEVKDKQDDSMALVRITHAPTTKPVASFLDCLARGTDTDEGVSVWKALKRWRRDGGKEAGEKELWKGIKIRMNDRGELIICV